MPEKEKPFFGPPPKETPGAERRTEELRKAEEEKTGTAVAEPEKEKKFTTLKRRAKAREFVAGGKEIEIERKTKEEILEEFKSDLKGVRRRVSNIESIMQSGDIAGKPVKDFHKLRERFDRILEDKKDLNSKDKDYRKKLVEISTDLKVFDGALKLLESRLPATIR